MVDKKGTSQTKVMSNSEEIKPLALIIIELCLVENEITNLYLPAVCHRYSWQKDLQLLYSQYIMMLMMIRCTQYK